MAGQLPFVLDKQKGPALPLWTGVTLEMLLTKLKAAAENQTPMGLKMNSLDFIVTLGDETLSHDARCDGQVLLREVRHEGARVAQRCRSDQSGCPELLARAILAARCGSSPGSSASHSGGNPMMQAHIREGLAILRGIKRSMEARNMWVEEMGHQNNCAQQ